MERDSEFGCGSLRGKDEDALEMCELSKMVLSPNSSIPYDKPAPYPRAVGFIALTELGSRFAYYGSRAVLTLYMRNVLKFSEDITTTLYHSFLLLCYCLPMIWGIAADSGLGMYNTIWAVNILFLLGNGFLTVSAFPLLPVPLSLLGLFLMAVATGGMKPCLAPFGAEQFILPQQKLRLQQYFSVFFIATTVGNMAATMLTPVLRKNVSCFGADTCYPMAFGTSTIAMFFAVVIFLVGNLFYKKKKSEGNMVIKVLKCVQCAICNWKKSTTSRTHWMDHADDKFPADLISDIKRLFGLLIYYAPMPMFYALLEQLGSRWTLQATRMSGLVANWHILPDQMQVSNAILMLVFTPIFEYVFYPIAGRCSLLRRPLQRMGLGLFVAGLSFLAAGLVETQIQIDQGLNNIATETSFINGLQCSLNLINNQSDNHTLAPSEKLHSSFGPGYWQVNLTDKTCSNSSSWSGQLPLGTFLLDSTVSSMNETVFPNNLWLLPSLSLKSMEGNAKLLVMVRCSSKTISELEPTFNVFHDTSQKYNLTPTTNRAGSRHIQLFLTKHFLCNTNNPAWKLTQTLEIIPNIYKINSEDTLAESVLIKSTYDFRTGGVYLILIDEATEIKVINLVRPNGVNILWQLPQYILMSWGQILFIVSGMEFSYTQAPSSMKSVLQALWNLMNAFGNVIVILFVSGQNYYPHSQASEYFQFAGLMGLNVIFFCVLAIRYKYVNN